MWILLLVPLLTLLAPLDVLKLKEIAIALFISKKKTIALRKPCTMNYSHQEKAWKVIGISIIPCITPTWSYIFTVCHIW